MWSRRHRHSESLKNFPEGGLLTPIFAQTLAAVYSAAPPSMQFSILFIFQEQLVQSENKSSILLTYVQYVQFFRNSMARFRQ